MRHTEVVQVRNKQRGMQMRMNQNEKRNISGMVEGDLGENVRCKGGEAIGMRRVIYSASTIGSIVASESLAWPFAHSMAKTEAFRNFLFAYFLHTCWR